MSVRYSIAGGMDQLMKSVGLVSNIAKSFALLGFKETVDPEIDKTSQIRYRPEIGVDGLCKITKFSRKEVQLLYRGFKQYSPNGVVSLEQFKEIYSQFFPHGAKSNADPCQYAGYVFNTFDRDKNGVINFEEFVIGLSILSRGTNEEKLRWVFDLYDVDQDGLLTKEDLERVIGSIYEMMGDPTEPPIEPTTVEQHVNYVFRKMDENDDGTITVDEFLEACSKDQSIDQSLNLFDTVFTMENRAYMSTMPVNA